MRTRSGTVLRNLQPFQRDYDAMRWDKDNQDLHLHGLARGFLLSSLFVRADENVEAVRMSLVSTVSSIRNI